VTLSEIDRREPTVRALLPAHPQDPRWIRSALAAAFLVHVGVLLVPLPSSPPPPSPEPLPTGPVIHATRLDPPEIERRPDRAPVRGERQLPVPDPDAPEEMLQPAPDPEPVGLPEWEGAPNVEIPLPPAEPPPITGPLPEDTRGLVVPVALPGRSRPVYPEVARRAGLEGTVILEAIVDEDGHVVSIRVVTEPRFDVGFTEAAIEAVRRWRYEPGLYGGEPVAVEITVVIDFVLN
jgi:protein TonB